MGEKTVWDFAMEILVLGPAVRTSTERLSEMQNLRPQRRSTESESAVIFMHGFYSWNI